MKKLAPGEQPLSPVIATRLTPFSYQLIRKLAKENDISVSTYLRIWIERTLKKDGFLPVVQMRKAQ